MAVTGPVRLRAALANVPAYRAGRPAAAGSYKISSNENPYPPLPSVRKVLEDAAGTVNRYPDFASTALVRALGRPLTTPSANPPGQRPPMCVDEARAYFEQHRTGYHTPEKYGLALVTVHEPPGGTAT